MDTKFVTINGQSFLKRSLRKEDLSICPLCWSEAAQKSGDQTHGCGVRSIWLPEQFHACQIHNVALVPLPYRDYTTCYDPIFRAHCEPGWIRNLNACVTERAPSKFEVSAKTQIATRSPMIAWLPAVQIDVLEKWCLGLGAFVRSGKTNPQNLEHQEQRRLIDIGLEITSSGLELVHIKVDRALARHQIRLSQTWLHGCALQSASPVERTGFREMFIEMGRQQGRYCLYSVRNNDPAEVVVAAALGDIARKTGRSKRWVKRALVVDGLLHESEPPKVNNLAAHMSKCKRHIKKLIAAKDSQESAAILGVGSRMFEGLINYGLLEPLRTRAFQKPRYTVEELDRFLNDIQNSIEETDRLQNDLRSISRVCFIARCDAGQVIDSILRGQLPSTQIIPQGIGLGAVLVSHTEVMQALKSQEEARRERLKSIGLYEVVKVLGLEYFHVKRLIAANLLQSEILEQDGDRAGGEAVLKESLDSFLQEYQTARTVAQANGVSVGTVRSIIARKQISKAAVVKGTPIYRKEDVRALV